MEGRARYIISEAQHKVKMQVLLFKRQEKSLSLSISLHPSQWLLLAIKCHASLGTGTLTGQGQTLAVTLWRT